MDHGLARLKPRFMRMGGSAALIAAILAALSAPACASGVEEVGLSSAFPGRGPFTYATAEQAKIKAEIVARGLSHVTSLAFLPGGDALVVERGERLRFLRDATGRNPQLVAGSIANVPAYGKPPHFHPEDMLGIQEVAVDPDFASNRFVYFTYNKPAGVDPGTGRLTSRAILARGRLDGMQLSKVTDLLVGEAMVAPGGSRILFGRNGDLFLSVGGMSVIDFEASQRTDNIYGKVLRIMRDGKIPVDNPFVGKTGSRPEIWTYGHRDPLGLAMEPRSGRLFASEHGPVGGDELNEVLRGRNYGWPQFTFGTDYGGSRLSSTPVGPGTEAPTMIWSPSIAPGGVVFYTGDALPGWKNNLFVASSRRGQINGTGGLIRIVFNDKLQELRQEALLGDLHQRVKDVRQGPDGLLYAGTDEADGVIVRIGPG